MWTHTLTLCCQPLGRVGLSVKVHFLRSGRKAARRPWFPLDNDGPPPCGRAGTEDVDNMEDGIRPAQQTLAFSENQTVHLCFFLPKVSCRMTLPNRTFCKDGSVSPSVVAPGTCGFWGGGWSRNTDSVPVLISAQGCCNKAPQSGGLKTTGILCQGSGGQRSETKMSEVGSC